jgi:hypothetical protein
VELIDEVMIDVGDEVAALGLNPRRTIRQLGISYAGSVAAAARP